MAQCVRETVRTRGKQHNRVTGSGGMLVGRVTRLAPPRPAGEGVAVGDWVASLISLSLTPLRIDEVRAVRPASAQLDVTGEAVLFASVPLRQDARTISPTESPLAALDVAGAAPQVARLVKPGAVVVIWRGGKSGILARRRALGRDGRRRSKRTRRIAAELEASHMRGIVAPTGDPVRDAAAGARARRSEADLVSHA